MGIEVHISGQNGFGKDLWRIHTPWISDSELRRVIHFKQTDSLTWMAQIPVETLRFILRRFEPSSWMKNRVRELHERLREPETEEIAIYLLGGNADA
jgi:hypothetical protein